MAQEKELCYLSTLQRHPQGSFLSPRRAGSGVLAQRRHLPRELCQESQLDAARDPELLPVVSIISIAAPDRPATTVTDNSQERYLNTLDRDMMKDKMRLILRVAGHSGHRRLVLGAFGCGVLKNPKHDVAHCWAEALKEDEFKGWWEVIVFAILEKTRILSMVRI